MAGIHVRFEIAPEIFLAHLTEAAYEVALKHGFKAPFIDVELDMMKAIEEVIRDDMRVAAVCGMTPQCTAATRFEPFSQAADDLLSRSTVTKATTR